MSVIPFSFSASDQKDPETFARRLNDYVGQANQVLAQIPPRVFTSVEFKTATNVVQTSWPAFQARGITPIAVCIARVQNLDNVSSTLGAAPWLDWTMQQDGMIKIIGAAGLDPLTRYRFTLEVIGAQ